MNDLEWYFLCAESDLGYKSSFGAILEQNAAYQTAKEKARPDDYVHFKPQQHTTWEVPYTKGRLDAIARARRIRTALAKMPAHLVQILYAFITQPHKIAQLSFQELTLAYNLHIQALQAYEDVCRLPYSRPSNKHKGQDKKLNPKLS